MTKQLQNMKFTKILKNEYNNYKYKHLFKYLTIQYYLDRLIKVFVCGIFDVVNKLNRVLSVEYSPFVIKNNIVNSNVICSGSDDNTIRFWDIRSNKNELYMIEGDKKEDNGIYSLKFIALKKKKDTKNVKYDLNLCYGSLKGPIRIWG
ncbi:hypothetical protein RFI_00175 [Reticulomyxa filosa]|uniref:WD-40 repeat protein n=1 Tax=Reticulomyxa filosa TaxID=46433 RepID=X6PGU4_RETFI|nr:hypothetical protein RFI_00175 [Reticulomyxa filosa]|eukprot:ETO36887.1 hypothetical protein RFI_00175 [Reticulomyxa filosa]